MYTTHGDHIPGTRLGLDNPPLKPARCGGINQCPDCALEAAAGNPKLAYFREEFYDEHTLSRVYDALRKAGASDKSARVAIKVMEDNGILFRERKNQQ